MFKYALLAAAILAVLIVPISLETDLFAQDRPGASTGVINVPAADELPDADAEDTEADEPEQADDEPVIIIEPADEDAPVDELDDIEPPVTIDPAAGNASPGGGPMDVPSAQDMPDREPTELDTPAPAPLAPPAAAPGQPAPAAQEDVPLWQPGEDAKAPAPAPGDELALEQQDTVVVLVDRSASMIGYWEWARDDAIELVRNLKDQQDFHLILFGHEDDVWELDSRELDAATLERKIQAIELLTFTTPAGSTDPQAGFQRALEVLGPRAGTIHFISDGVFNHPGRVRRDVRNMTAGESVVVQTHLYGDALPQAVSIMQAIARDNDGTYVNATQYP